jgi:hypothetical protein
MWIEKDDGTRLPWFGDGFGRGEVEGVAGETFFA